jgi:signal transduction histidine kinase
MDPQGRVRPAHRLVALIATITVVPLGVFLWLGLRLIEQDRVLEQQQARERLQTATDLIVATLQRLIAASEQKLASGAQDWPEGAVSVTFFPDHVEAFPRRRIAFLPAAPPLAHVPAERFQAAEAIEFQRHDRRSAIAAYRMLASSPDRAVRSGALLRLARNLAADGREDEALAVYAQLQEIDDVVETGVPVALAASWARCSMLEQLHRDTALRSESAALHSDLIAGRWAVAEATYATYLADAERWAGIPHGPQRSETLAAAVTRLWEQRFAGAAPPLAWRRHSLAIDGNRFTILWQTSGSPTRALVAGQPFVESEWRRPAAMVAREQNVDFRLQDVHDTASNADGPPTGVPARASSIAVSGPRADLPWDVAVWSTGTALSTGFLNRRRLLLGGFALLSTLSLAASWLIVRAVTRDLALARAQADFVAAVSHEFRTPLTTLRQFTDRLRENPALDAERRRVCYDAQARATDRLTRLVESVLDFGRMEAGAHAFRLQPQDCSDIVQHVVADFSAQPQAAGRPIDFQRNGTVAIHADAEALSRALWNLLDNAVKYSPDGGAIAVSLDRADDSVRIAVRDQGLGIPTHERREIFRKFQRGEDARTRGISGTGMGLAMVDQIVRAHSGRIEVDSTPGAGSTFTIVLPIKG